MPDRDALIREIAQAIIERRCIEYGDVLIAAEVALAVAERHFAAMRARVMPEREAAVRAEAFCAAADMARQVADGHLAVGAKADVPHAAEIGRCFAQVAESISEALSAKAAAIRAREEGK